MRKVHVEPTATAQWQALVQSAAADCGAALGESVEAYMVFMLMRFAEQNGLGQEALALEFLRGLQGGSGSTERLRATGDECLLVCGLFPQRVRRRTVPLRYYVDLGRGAYDTLAQSGAASDAEPFDALATQFVTLMGILQAMRAADAAQQLSAVEAAEVACTTSSRTAWDRVAPTDATLMPGGDRRH